MFIAYVNQTDGGCGYTIACGKVLWKLNAKTKEDAYKELKEQVMGKWNEDEGCWDDGYWYEESEISEITLYEVNDSENIHVRDWYKEGYQKIENWDNKSKEDEERKQYEKLKKKFGE